MGPQSVTWDSSAPPASADPPGVTQGVDWEICHLLPENPENPPAASPERRKLLESQILHLGLPFSMQDTRKEVSSHFCHGKVQPAYAQELSCLALIPAMWKRNSFPITLVLRLCALRP